MAHHLLFDVIHLAFWVGLAARIRHFPKRVPSQILADQRLPLHGIYEAPQSPATGQRPRRLPKSCGGAQRRGDGRPEAATSMPHDYSSGLHVGQNIARCSHALRLPSSVHNALLLSTVLLSAEATPKGNSRRRYGVKCTRLEEIPNEGSPALQCFARRFKANVLPSDSIRRPQSSLSSSPS